MGIKSVIAILATAGFAASAQAEEQKPFSIYGDFAGSLSFYDNEYNAAPFVGGAAGTQDDFNIDLVEINLEKNWSQSKLHLSIGYGSVARTFGNVGNGQNMLNVMNAYYQMNTSYGLGFSFGRFESPVGFETYNLMDNSQYTRSYGFLLAPFFSTGVMIDYTFDWFHAGLIISEGSGMYQSGSDRNKTATIVLDFDPIQEVHFDVKYAMGTEGDNIADPVNGDSALMGTSGGTAGAAQISILDVTAKYEINEMFDVAVNYINHTQKWGEGVAAAMRDNSANSLGLYANAHLGMFHIGARYEMFNYDGGILAYNGLNSATTLPIFGANSTDNTINSFTLTAKAEIDQNAMVLLEYRMDNSDDQIWQSKDGAANSTDSFNTITAALMYRF